MKKAAIIPHTDAHWQGLSWQQQLAGAYRSPAALLDALNIAPQQIEAGISTDNPFAVLVPQSFVERMRSGDPHDPLLRQVLPLASEHQSAPGFVEDPLEESDSNPVPGMIHKYRNRVLLIAAGGCAVNCRYCFRRHFDYSANNPSRQQWQQAFDYIAQHPDIDEVIFSGGDPLLLSDRYLGSMIEQIADIPHLKRLRLHSRLPIVLPARITEGLCEQLSKTRLQALLVVHANHSHELNSETEQALQQLRSAGVVLLNQTVLLKGVNDCPQQLKALSEALFTQGVMPYYLNLLDKVSGTHHFYLPHAQALAIYRQLMASTSGYLVPKMVQEIPGHPAKQPVPCSLKP